MLFLDYEHSGKSYGKMYKIKMSQFKDVLAQEQRCKLYDATIYVGVKDNLPIFTFTSSHKLNNITLPSKEYCSVIEKGLYKLFDIDRETIYNYFNKGCIE